MRVVVPASLLALTIWVDVGCAMDNPLPAATDTQYDLRCDDETSAAGWASLAAVFYGEVLSVTEVTDPDLACAPSATFPAVDVEIAVEAELLDREPDAVGSRLTVRFIPNGLVLANPMPRVDDQGGLRWEYNDWMTGEALRPGQMIGASAHMAIGQGLWFGAGLFAINDGLEFQVGNTCVSGAIRGQVGASLDDWSSFLRSLPPGTTPPPASPEDEAVFRGLRATCLE